MMEGMSIAIDFLSIGAAAQKNGPASKCRAAGLGGGS
jgi:hypothetical protein